MATTAVTPAQAELISSLSQDDIPIKLRCATCSKLAMNAFRLPCCEQAICENCQSSLPSSCPVCEHTPVAAEDCKPHKSLRTTIKVFLRTEEKKREAVRAKALKDTPPVTPVEDVTAPIPTEEPVSLLVPGAKADEPTPATESEPAIEHAPGDTDEVAASERLPTEDQQDVPQQSIEEITPGQEQTEDGTANVDDAEAQEADKDLNGQVATMPMGNLGIPGGLDATAMGGFPNMAMMGQGGDMNPMQMQMMMAMQNGVANPFGGFPMMGMPGMSMDPMAMQNMYMNGAFGGMGMNGMNMGMGMGGMTGFDGGAGAGFNGGWNSQQSWNGPDNFNSNAAASAGMGHTDFGASNKSGYSYQQQRAAGYNQGNYGRTSQYNDYGHVQGFYGRGRGRGRGGFGRGGYGHSDYSQQGNYQTGFAGPMSETGSAPPGPKESANVEPASVDEFGREIRTPSIAEANIDEVAAQKDGDDGAKTNHDVETAQKTDQDQGPAGIDSTDVQHERQHGQGAEAENGEPKPIQTLEEIEQSQYAYHNGYGYQGHGGYMNRNVVQAAPVDVPVNAPTGPKAMREGLPNKSFVSLRGRGAFGNIGRGHGRYNSITNDSTEAGGQDAGRDEEDRGREREPGFEEELHRQRSKSPSRSRSRSRSASRRDERRERHSNRRHRETSVSSDSKEEERRRERRKRHSRRHDDEPSKAAEPVDDAAAPPTETEADERSRSQSPAESRRSTHRSRRDRDGERSERHRDRSRDRDRRDRDRDRDRDYKSSSHKHRSSHRSHRSRSRSRSRDRDHERASRREREHRRRHRDDEPRTEEKAAGDSDKKREFKPPAGPRAMMAQKGAMEIRGASGRGGSATGSAKENKAPAKVKEVDAHTAEREARDRERLMKEAQRMAGLAGLVGVGRKREREREGEERRGKKVRGRGRVDGGDEEEGEGEEERVRRNEREREGGRWA